MYNKIIEVLCMNKVKKAIIPAAGLGTRFLPATKSLPKEMFTIIDTPTIQYIVEEAVKSGIEEICISIIYCYTACIGYSYIRGIWMGQ